MNTPSLNVDGYNTASVLNVTAFNNVNFLLAHGSGDDNVHYMNSASLLDKFTQEKVRGFRFRMFTDRCVPLSLFLHFSLPLSFSLEETQGEIRADDSHHSMDIRGAYRELYEMMTEFLDEKWGRGGTVRGT
jgi:dipeptidyl aminopeptidase